MLQHLPQLQPNQKVYVFDDEAATRYVSYIKAFDSHLVYLTVPLNNALPVPSHKKLSLKEGSVIKIQLPVSGQLYQFTGNVSGTSQSSERGYVVVSAPQNIERVEMRRYMRVKKVLRLKYATLSSLGEGPDYKSAEALDISAGGMKLAVSEFIEQGRQLVLQFVLSLDNKYSRFEEISVVTRSVKPPGEDTFYVGVEFKNIKKNKSEFISRYVMKTHWTQVL